MLSDQDFLPTEQPDLEASSAEAVDRALDEVEHTLAQMLTLAQLSASDLNMDRGTLQKTMERLQHKINQIADTI